MTGELSKGRLYMKKNSTPNVIAPNYGDLISRTLKISKKDFDAAVRSAHSELVRSLTDFETQFGILPSSPEEKPVKRSKSKTVTPKASKGRPKSTGAKRKTAKGGTGAKRGRKPKNSNGKTLREAVAEAVRSGMNSTPAIVEHLQSHGFDSKSLSTQVSQELSRLVKTGSVNRVGRGSYEWNGSASVETPSLNPTQVEGTISAIEEQDSQTDVSV